MRQHLTADEVEDIVNGKRTRFKYREVPRNNYGFTPMEILLSDEKFLNAQVSLRKLAPYRTK